MSSLSAGTIYVDVRPDTSALNSGATKGAMGKAMGTLAKVAAGAFAVKKVFDFGGAAIDAAEESEAILGKLGQTLESMGRDISLATLDATANSIQSLTGVSDESIKQGQTLLATFGNISDELLNDLTPSMVDFAAQFTDGNMRSAATMLGKALDNPLKGLSAMSRVGVSFTEQQEEMIRAMVEAGDVAGAQGIIMEAVTPQIDGAAEASATASGKMSAAWGDFMEMVGRILLPVFERVVTALQSVVEWGTNLMTKLKSGEPILGSFGRYFDIIREAATKVWGFFKDDLIGVWEALVDVYKRNLQPALSNLFKAFQKILPVLKTVVTVYLAIQAVILKVALKVLPILLKVLGFVIQVISKVVEWVATLFGWLHDKLAGAFQTVADIAKGAWARIRDAWNGAKSFFSGIWDSIKGGAIAVWNAIARAWNTTIGSLSFRAPDWVPILGGKGWDVPDISYAALASGGLVTQPTSALIGEAGPEAVIPLRGRTMEVRVVNPQDFPDGSAALALAGRAERTRR